MSTMENYKPIYEIASLISTANSKLTTIIHYEEFHKEANHNSSFVYGSAKAVLDDLNKVQEISLTLTPECRTSIGDNIIRDLKGLDHAYKFLKLSYELLNQVPLQSKIAELEFLFE